MSPYIHHKMTDIQDTNKNEVFKDTDNTSKSDFFLNSEVEKGGYEPIKIRFETLINSNCQAPFDWYKDLSMDKSYASKIRRGLIIPPKWLRIKIAQYFKTDSATIWTNQDLPYIREQLKKQNREHGEN